MEFFFPFTFHRECFVDVSDFSSARRRFVGSANTQTAHATRNNDRFGIFMRQKVYRTEVICKAAFNRWLVTASLYALDLVRKILQITPMQKTENAVTPDKIMQIGLGFWASKALLSAIELGLFSILAKGPADAECVRQKLG